MLRSIVANWKHWTKQLQPPNPPKNPHSLIVKVCCSYTIMKGHILSESPGKDYEKLFLSRLTLQTLLHLTVIFPGYVRYPVQNNPCLYFCIAQVYVALFV